MVPDTVPDTKIITLKLLIIAARDIWDRINPRNLEQLSNTIVNRLTAVINAKGYVKYRNSKNC
jgi:hypothetical protein